MLIIVLRSPEIDYNCLLMTLIILKIMKNTLDMKYGDLSV